MPRKLLSILWHLFRYAVAAVVSTVVTAVLPVLLACAPIVLAVVALLLLFVSGLAVVAAGLSLIALSGLMAQVLCSRGLWPNVTSFRRFQA